MLTNSGFEEAPLNIFKFELVVRTIGMEISVEATDF